MKPKTYGIIYKATNILNGKCYIGQTVQSLHRRRIAHTTRIKYNKNNYLYNAMDKDGIDNFQWEVLKEHIPSEALDMMETFMIMVNHSHWSENGYNCTWGGDDQPMFNPESRKKISEKFKKLWANPEYRKKQVESMEKGRKDKPLTEETKKKMREARKKRWTDPEYRKKISEAMKERWVNPETRKKMSEVWKGRTHTEEAKKKMSEAKKGKKRAAPFTFIFTSKKAQ